MYNVFLTTQSSVKSNFLLEFGPLLPPPPSSSSADNYGVDNHRRGRSKSQGAGTGLDMDLKVAICYSVPHNPYGIIGSQCRSSSSLTLPLSLVRLSECPFPISKASKSACLHFLFIFFFDEMEHFRLGV